MSNGRYLTLAIIPLAVVGAWRAGSMLRHRAADPTPPAGCAGLPTATQLHAMLQRAPHEVGPAGGLFEGKREWGAVVDRSGTLCAVTEESSGDWPGSQSIAEAKAYTANAYSMDTLALSTARLYTLTQPGHSLWSITGSNVFNPACEQPPADAGRSVGRICGGEIAFAGGVPLYRNGRIVGGLGASGDTSCADHEVAKRVRHMLGMDPPKGEHADDIIYPSVDGASIYAHPLCYNTWRNGHKVGSEKPVSHYQRMQLPG